MVLTIKKFFKHRTLTPNFTKFAIANLSIARPTIANEYSNFILLEPEANIEETFTMLWPTPGLTLD